MDNAPTHGELKQTVEAAEARTRARIAQAEIEQRQWFREYDARMEVQNERLNRAMEGVARAEAGAARAEAAAERAARSAESASDIRRTLWITSVIQIAATVLAVLGFYYASVNANAALVQASIAAVAAGRQLPPPAPQILPLPTPR